MTNRELAHSIRLQLENTGRYGPIDAVDPHDGSVQRAVEAILTAALDAARPPAGHIMESDGTVRPMARGFDGQPTKLDVTHDGFVVGNGAKLWRYNKAREEIELHEAGWYDRRSDRITWTPEVCWTTREAAEAARAAKGGA